MASNAQADNFADLGFEPADQPQQASAAPAQPEPQDHSDLGFEPVDNQQPDPNKPGLGQQVMEGAKQAVETAYPNLVPVAMEFGKRLTSNVEGVMDSPIDPASKAGHALVNTVQGVFDEAGEKTAERLAYHGLNPYVSATAGALIQNAPNIVFSTEGEGAIRASGNAEAEGKILSSIMSKTKPLELGYKSAIEPPTTILPGGEAAILVGTTDVRAMGPSGQLLLPSKTAQGEGFAMRDMPDLATQQQGHGALTESGAQPTYPENMVGTKTLKGYASRKKLSSDVPDFQKTLDAVASSDRYNPAASELVDEARRQYIGMDPRIKVETDLETGMTKFKLVSDPDLGTRVFSEPEVQSAQATKNSSAVQALGLDDRMFDSSPIIPDSEIMPVMKNEIVAGSRNWMQDAWNRVGVAAEDAISKMGDAGKALANGIRTVRDVPQVKYGDFSADFDKFFKGMSKIKMQAIGPLLADALEGKSIPESLNIKLPDGLVEFVQSKLKVIADQAEQSGLSVRSTSGESIPFAPRDNYYPRMLRQEIFDSLLSGNNKVMREIAEKMIANKLETNLERAVEKVNYLRNQLGVVKYGHLERAREFDLPTELYDRDALRVIPEYMNSALHRIEHVNQFGVQNELAHEMFKNILIDQGPKQAELARRLFERFAGIEPRDTVALKGIQGIKNLAAGMLIQAQSSVLQLGQAMTPAYEAGFIKAVKGFAKAFTDLGEDQAKRAGQVWGTAASQYMTESYGGGYGFAGKFADKMLSMTGFARMDHFLRKYTSLVGQDYIPSLVQKLLKDGNNKQAIVELEHLGFDVGKIKTNKGLSTEEINVGAKRFSDMVQGAPDVTRLPIWWTSPVGKLVFQFKNFSYVMGKQNASLIKRAVQTGNITRLGEMAVGLPATGYVLKTLRDAMVGQNDSEITGDQDIDTAIQVLGNATAFGPAMDLFSLALQGPDKLKSFFAPIGVKNLTEIGGAAGQSIKQGDLAPLTKTLTRKIPLVGRILSNKMEQ